MSSFLSFLRRHVTPMVLLVIGGTISIYGPVSDVYDLWKAGLPWGVWTAIGLALFFIAVVAILQHVHSSSVRLEPNTDDKLPSDWKEQLTLVVGKTFLNCEVHLDGHRYHNCTFQHVTFVYDGGPMALESNKIGAHSIATTNDAMNRFINLLASFGHLKHDLFTEEGVMTQSDIDKLNDSRRDSPEEH